MLLLFQWVLNRVNFNALAWNRRYHFSYGLNQIQLHLRRSWILCLRGCGLRYKMYYAEPQLYCFVLIWLISVNWSLTALISTLEASSQVLKNSLWVHSLLETLLSFLDKMLENIVSNRKVLVKTSENFGVQSCLSNTHSLWHSNKSTLNGMKTVLQRMLKTTHGYKIEYTYTKAINDQEPVDKSRSTYISSSNSCIFILIEYM